MGIVSDCRSTSFFVLLTGIMLPVRNQISAQILADAGHPKKCKVVYFLSGSADLTECMSSLLRKNVRA